MPITQHHGTVARVVLLALMVGWTGAVQAQQARDGLDYAYHELKMDDGTTIRYALVLPDGFEASKTYPAFLALPPGPQKEGSVDWGLESFGGEAAARRGWIVVSPRRGRKPRLDRWGQARPRNARRTRHFHPSQDFARRRPRHGKPEGRPGDRVARRGSSSDAEGGVEVSKGSLRRTAFLPLAQRSAYCVLRKGVTQYEVRNTA